MIEGLGGRSGPQWERYQRRKRVVDLVLSGGLLALLAPLLAFVGWRIKREDGGPILYRATRTGKDDVTFQMFKFRTMVMGADRLGGPSTADDDPRLTRVGRRLRRWKIDELPQLLNVVRGEMSLVGPRPQVPAAVDTYTPTERLLLTVHPGMSDWASIRFSDEGGILAGSEDPDLAYERLIRPGKSWLGLAYVREASLRKDIEVMVKTLTAIVGGRPTIPAAPSDAARLLGLPDVDETGSERAIRTVE